MQPRKITFTETGIGKTLQSVIVSALTAAAVAGGFEIGKSLGRDAVEQERVELRARIDALTRQNDLAIDLFKEIVGTDEAMTRRLDLHKQQILQLQKKIDANKELFKEIVVTDEAMTKRLDLHQQQILQLQKKIDANK